MDKAFREADDVAKRKAAETAAQSGGNPDELYKRFYQEELDSRMPRMLTSSGAESTFDPRVVEMENAVKTLMMRKECIRDVLEGRYQYTPPGRGALEKTDGNKEISFLRNETGGFPLKRAA